MAVENVFTTHRVAYWQADIGDVKPGMGLCNPSRFAVVPVASLQLDLHLRKTRVRLLSHYTDNIPIVYAVSINVDSLFLKSLI